MHGEGAWSFCNPPTDNDQASFDAQFPDRIQRLDPVCQLDIDGKSVLRGLVLSIPDL
jgi:hypothetical protein